jgi:hypothetical protein
MVRVWLAKLVLVLAGQEIFTYFVYSLFRGTIVSSVRDGLLNRCCKEISGKISGVINLVQVSNQV